MRCSKTDYDARSVNAVLGVFLRTNFQIMTVLWTVTPSHIFLCTHKCEIWHETVNAKLESLLST